MNVTQSNTALQYAFRYCLEKNSMELLKSIYEKKREGVSSSGKVA
jgi:hypothetical protein